MTLSVVIFDVDGTLIDSQAHIMASMVAAFETCGLPVPERADVLGGIGLSLPLLMARLAGPEDADRLVDAYRQGFAKERAAHGTQQLSPLYPGTRDMLDRLHGRDDLVLAVATGKSKRGLDAVVDAYDLNHLFISRQTADFHPSKPHPSMIQTVLADAGVDADRAVMVGDTSYDIDMGRAAGTHTIAVPWGYHRAEDLNADRVIRSWDDLDGALDTLLEQ